MDQQANSRPRRRGRDRGAKATPQRQVNYRQLRNPFPPMPAFSEDRIAAIHHTALRVLEEQGMKVLLPQARALFRQAGARVDEASGMVFVGRDIVEAALASAPRSILCRAGTRDRDVLLDPGALTFLPGSGTPHATDLKRGRRPGTGRDFRELVQIAQHFDVMHMLPPMVEPQDIPTQTRHLFTMEAQLTLSDKLPFVYARGTPQVEDSFEMLHDFRGLSDAEFRAAPHCFTIINTNSPRVLDIPMAQGLIDFARFGQVSIVTPFTLMGAMAPITVAGAVMLSHAEALAAITLTQLAKPGAPVLYGTFTSNVDMKSGAPAFGTPEHFKASLAAGQLARLIGLPWRCAGGSAANLNDAQAANETQFALWGSLMAGATVILHSAGWLEGGLTLSYEKMITDMEVLQMVAEMCVAAAAEDSDIAFDALAEVEPAGHFFGAAHTLERYQTEFYDPLVADWSNFGTWTEKGERSASERASDIWQNILSEDARPPVDGDRFEAMQTFIAKRTAAGGAPPES
ncbi:trimethylamine methyltransferase family protein [Thalassovita aquimarina]|uniref:Methyltransferase n=1 Tax=Thalassovita aquimarina TaxID=2785917 RepID=A0ABS5HPA4_9RHOB|nr:trimethylamine methyltransferase family protein [Thalassovita aquimarina]MBR9650692.1 trimethylamine methyltransferase family protein [Thalassovita aquimarina]